MDEKKKYAVVGTVSIGTDEYRDLIEGFKDAQNDADKYRSAKWELDSKVRNLEAELKAVLCRCNELEAFVNSDEAVGAKFKLWRIEQQM